MIINTQNQTVMYYIRKYADCWAIHNDDTGTCRKLTDQEVKLVSRELLALTDPKVRTVFTDQIRSVQKKP